MRKTFVLFTFIFLLLFSQNVNAVTIESQSDKSNKLQTFIVLASPEMVSTAIQLRLDVEGGMVTSFSAGDDGLLSIGVCDEETNKFTSNRVCVDIANISGAFEYGDVLGVLTVEKVDNFAQVKITKSEDNAYMGPDGEFVTDDGLAFTLYGATPSTKKDTTDSSYAFLYMFLLIAFLSGVVFGTTFTTLGHVMQSEKSRKKNK